MYLKKKKGYQRSIGKKKGHEICEIKHKDQIQKSLKKKGLRKGLVEPT